MWISQPALILSQLQTFWPWGCLTLDKVPDFITMFLKLSQAGRRRGRKEKLLRLNNEAKQTLQSKEGEKVDRVEKEKTDKKGIRMNTARILKIFTIRKRSMYYSKQSEKKICEENIKPVGKPYSKIIPQMKPSLEENPNILMPIKTPSEPQFIEPVRLLLPRTSCTVNLQHLGSSHNSQSRWVNPGRQRKSFHVRPMNCSMVSRTSGLSRSSTSSRTSSRSRRERKPKKRRKIIGETCQGPSPVVFPIRQTYQYKTVYTGII